MRASTLASTLLALASSTQTLAQEESGSIGYTCHPHCITPTVPLDQTSNFTFGANYAVLNLDLINGIVGSVVNTTAGDAFIDNTARWIAAVHALETPPLSIFTRIYFSTADQPEVGPDSPFGQVSGALGTQDAEATMLHPAFETTDSDVILRKIRYYAGAGNPLEIILRAQGIDTVVLSGIRTSGVILNTAYQLFNADYKVYVIANNTIEPSPDEPGINAAILEGIIPKLPADVITIEQAMAALQNSGPAMNGTMGGM